MSTNIDNIKVLDFVAYARHAGLQTRMLDWTYDFWTAVYFAASGIIDEVRKNISLEKNPKYYMDFDDRMVIWLFNLSQWRELTDYTSPFYPYGIYESTLHFTTPRIISFVSKISALYTKLIFLFTTKYFSMKLDFLMLQ